jgi:hypothetical protein
VERRIIIFSFSSGILTNISFFGLSVLPGVSDHIVEVYFCAGIRHVAADGVGVEETFVNFDVL